MAFHPYPQLIPQVFNPGGFGPPRRLTVASPWPWVDHSASGLYPATTRPIRTRFRYGYPTRVNLATKHNSQAHSSKGTPSPKGSDGLQAHGFRYYFTPLPGYFSSFPHGTSPLSVIREYLGLPGGPGRFTANSTSSLLLGSTVQTACSVFAYGALTHYGDPFQKSSASTTPRPRRLGRAHTTTSHNTHTATPAGLTQHRFSLIRFRSPLLTESRLFSLPVGTEMFHFPTFPLIPYVFRHE